MIRATISRQDLRGINFCELTLSQAYATLGRADAAMELMFGDRGAHGSHAAAHWNDMKFGPKWKRETAMPLIKCPDCGKDVSDRALLCPACGAPGAAAPDTAKQSRWSLVSLCLIIAGAFLTMAATDASDPESPSGMIGLLLTVAGVITLLANQFRPRGHNHRKPVG